MKTYREAWSRAGHPGKGQVFLRVPVYVAETEEAAREEPRESIMHLLRYIGDRLAASAGASGTRAIENRAERGQKMQSIDYAEVLRERMIVGTPASVVARLQEVQDTLGLDGILAELNPGSLIPHERVMTALKLLCEEVMPKFK
ncbi:MAG: LLM class flavin-dependent oxidoreductase [Reyranellales bacterium]